MNFRNPELSFNLRKPLKVYYNLHKNCLSVKAYSVDKKDYRLWVHLEEGDALLIKEVKYSVSVKGRNRTRKEGVRNVHAHVVGKLADILGEFKVAKGCVRYNPFKQDFFTLNGKNIFKSKYAKLKHKQIEVLEDWK